MGLSSKSWIAVLIFFTRLFSTGHNSIDDMAQASSGLENGNHALLVFGEIARLERGSFFADRALSFLTPLRPGQRTPRGRGGGAMNSGPTGIGFIVSL